MSDRSHRGNPGGSAHPGGTHPGGAHPGGTRPGGTARKRRPAHTQRPEPSWRAVFIRVGVAIALFNIVAGLLAWYFVFSPRRH